MRGTVRVGCSGWVYQAWRGIVCPLGAWLDEGTDVYAYFNNDDEGHAVVDAEWFRARLDPAWSAPALTSG